MKHLQFLLILLSFSACQIDSSFADSSTQFIFQPPTNHIIIYKKENQCLLNGEALKIKNQNTLKSLPIGRYPIDSSHNIIFPKPSKKWVSSGHIQLPKMLNLSTIVQATAINASHICIFPNQPNPSFEACFACPDWQTREYARLMSWYRTYLSQ